MNLSNVSLFLDNTNKINFISDDRDIDELSGKMVNVWFLIHGFQDHTGYVVTYKTIYATRKIHVDAE